MNWKDIIIQEQKKPYFKEILNFLKLQIQNKKIIFPSLDKIFNSFQLTPFNKVKVVILGQDPYIYFNQAHGLSFSVYKAKITPSLKNIFKELKNDLNLVPKTNNLTLWALEGVLLLNTILTVEKGNSLSHKNIGWEIFTKNILNFLFQKQNIVYILWGNYAQNYSKFINIRQNYIIKSAHPSPLSAHRGFFNSKPFSKTNQYLIKNNIIPINWDLNRKI
ncbi:uracil-DNA glycosylase [Texas Phoenix palm phytoplasma]|uniref:Uracil-DNA glycosylase n=2 Tax=Texas Phoenix palm phytoplasma TaxID=176709 RepID=A0ABS5BIL9_9MOLU|nr:uracil-DNA glycosylase [Texas Phoenix palm phytoplasma]